MSHRHLEQFRWPFRAPLSPHYDSFFESFGARADVTSVGIRLWILCRVSEPIAQEAVRRVQSFGVGVAASLCPTVIGERGTGAHTPVLDLVRLHLLSKQRPRAVCADIAHNVQP